jgi:hypothetical protein
MTVRISGSIPSIKKQSIIYRCFDTSFGSASLPLPGGLPPDGMERLKAVRKIPWGARKIPEENPLLLSVGKSQFAPHTRALAPPYPEGALRWALS